jgi:hypothetical protein
MGSGETGWGAMMSSERALSRLDVPRSVPAGDASAMDEMSVKRRNGMRM